MEDTRYNGWKNYETWAVKLWMDNEEGSYRFWREQTRLAVGIATPTDFLTAERMAVHTLAGELQLEHEDALPDMEGFASDLLGAAMSEVDWYEIAESLIGENAEETAYQNANA